MSYNVTPFPLKVDFNLTAIIQVYGDIVGRCAWAPKGCPITKQRYIDWFYGALVKVDTIEWPK
jgi:hypothetical protein